MKSAPSIIASTATTRAGEQPQPGAGQPADRPFGEHAEPFLHALIAGEAGGRWSGPARRR